MEKVKIYTDGACRGNPGPGGFCCIIVQDGKTRELKGGNKSTTNNIMEMTAIIVALKQLKEPCEVELTTDSQYVVKGMTEWMAGWVRRNWVNASKQPVKNKDLWLELKKLNERHKIKWVWVRGHNGHPENERADILANQGVDELY